MEKEIKIGNLVLKVYDLVVILLIMVGAILLAVLNGAFNWGIPGSIAGPAIIFVELAYIFGVVNKRAKK